MRERDRERKRKNNREKDSERVRSSQVNKVKRLWGIQQGVPDFDNAFGSNWRGSTLKAVTRLVPNSSRSPGTTGLRQGIPPGPWSVTTLQGATLQFFEFQ